MEATFNDVKITERATIWKLLAASANIYEFGPEVAHITTAVDHWLFLANDLMDGKISEDDLCRRMSVTLSHQDYLVLGAKSTIADIIISLLMTSDMHRANNIELWLARVSPGKNLKKK